jgi:hypothetical protein
MELALNLAWVMLAALMAGLWLHFASHTGTNRRMQLVALAVLLLTLFPVISVTDDLLAAQNPAETDCCQRRAHALATAHCTHSPVAALPAAVIAGVTLGVVHGPAIGGLRVIVFDHPELSPVHNRPPPTA